jgi:hypothetical protein
MLKKLMLAVVVSNALVAAAMADSDVRSRPDKDAVKKYEQQFNTAMPSARLPMIMPVRPLLPILPITATTKPAGWQPT